MRRRFHRARRHGASGQIRRLAAAGTIILVALSLLWAADIAGRGALPESPLSSDKSFYGLPEHYAPEGDIPASLFAQIENLPSQARLPDGFAAEVLDPAALPVQEQYAEEGVVGFLLSNEEAGLAGQAAIARELEELLERGGWQRVGTSEAVQSYFKEDGSYHWLYLQHAGLGPYVSVVLNYEKEES